MIAIKVLAKSFGAVAVVGGVAGGVGYKIHHNIQTKKEEERQKEISENNIELNVLLEKLQELNEKLETLKENIGSTEEDIKGLKEKNIESEATSRNLKKEIEQLTTSINALSQKVQEKTIFKNEKEKEELGYQKTVDSWKAKVAQTNLNKELNDDLLQKTKKELNSKNANLIKARKEKNDAEKEKNSALLKTANDSNLVSAFKALLAQHTKEEKAALEIYNEKKWKICVSTASSQENTQPLTCKNKVGEIIKKSEEITERKLNQLTADLERKKSVVLKTAESLAKKEKEALITNKTWEEKTNVFNQKTRSLSQKGQVITEIKNKKTTLENQAKEIALTIIDDLKNLALAETSLEPLKALKLQAQNDLSEVLREKATEEEKKQTAQNSLSTITQDLDKDEKTLSTYKEKLENFNLEKQNLEREISTKEKLKTTLDKKIEDLKLKNA